MTSDEAKANALEALIESVNAYDPKSADNETLVFWDRLEKFVLCLDDHKLRDIVRKYFNGP